MNPRQKKFVEEYLKHFNASRAAREAGYSAKTAYSIGQRLLKNVEVSASIREAVEMPADEVKAGLAEIARGDLADLMDLTPLGFTLKLTVIDKDGKVIANPKTKLIRKIRQKTTTFLAKTETGEDREVVETEIELYSRHDALRDIGKMHGLFVDRTEVSGPEGGAIPVNLYDAALKKVYGPGSAT